MSDNPNEANQLQMENEIPICGDGWLAVFDLIAPRQLGLEIALLSHRFDYYVEEHFKTRKWTLGTMAIYHKIGGNGAKEMQIINYTRKSLPIPQVPVPKKVVGFKEITIRYGDQNVIEFLHHFRRLFASSGIYLTIHHKKTDFIENFIWPLISSNICALQFDSDNLLSTRHNLISSILRDNCPSLRFIYAADLSFYSTDNRSAALDGQAVSQWLFTPRADGYPKVLQCNQFAQSKMDSFKAEFANASSPVNFIMFISIWRYADPLLTFQLINHSTEEQMTLKQLDNEFFLMVRCPIAGDELNKWAIEWGSYNKRNRITFSLDDY